MSATTLISILIVSICIASFLAASPLKTEVKQEQDLSKDQSLEETRIISWITNALSGIYNVTRCSFFIMVINA
jgi:hypothetical protein